MELKHALFKLKDIKADETGTFTGYASVYGLTDSDGDVIEKGAFARACKSMKEGVSRPKMCWQHDSRELIGTWLEMSEDDRGLKVKGQLILELAKAKEAYALMKAGEMDSMSVGFNIVDGEKSKTGRTIKDADLWEISLVTWGANPAAKITNAKTIKDFERFLRDAGYSRKQAVTIASHGFRAFSADQGDPDQPDETTEAIKKLIDKIKP